MSPENIAGTGKDGEAVRISGRKIKEKRHALGLSQVELGALIGVSSQQVMRYEVHGIENMRVRRLVALCEVFGCTANDLLEGGE